MKFSSFCFFGVLGLASAQPNLRASSATIDNEALSLINTSVIYEGIKTEYATIDDMAIIQMSVAAALDEIYGDVSDNEVEDGMLGICNFICRIVRDRNPPKVGPPPPKPAPIICGAWGCGPNSEHPPIYVEPDGRCGNRCRRRHHMLAAAADGDESEVTSMALVSLEGKIPEIQDLSLRETFDELVCENMRASGSKTLEDVHDCQVYFYALGAPMCATQDVFIKIEGVAMQSEDDLNKIEMAAKSAGIDLTFQGVSAIADNEAPTTFVLAEIGQSHSSCNANIDATAHALCASLHDQGFEAAHGCEIAAFGVSMMAQGKAAVDMEVA